MDSFSSSSIFLMLPDFSIFDSIISETVLFGGVSVLGIGLDEAEVSPMH